MSHSAFIDRLRQRNPPPEERELPPVTLAPPRVTGNPFMTAAEDLAVQWEGLRDERDALKAQNEHFVANNTYLAERVDSLERELAHRTKFFDLETNRLTQRADR